VKDNITVCQKEKILRIRLFTEHFLNFRNPSFKDLRGMFPKPWSYVLGDVSPIYLNTIEITFFKEGAME